jgi:hypothetical protein
MFCGQCGRPVDSKSRFCSGCGSVVPQPNTGLLPSAYLQLQTTPRRRKTIFRTLALIAISFFLLLLAMSVVYNKASEGKMAVAERGKKEAEKASAPQPQAQNGEPVENAEAEKASAPQPQTQNGEPVENAPDQTSKASEPDGNSEPDGEAYPYEVLRNPYGYKGRTLLLKVSHVPFVLRDVIESTPDPRPGIGFVGIQFERSLSETTALFAIKGVNLDLPPTHPTQSLWRFGEMVVDLGKADGDLSELDTTKDWIVRAKGVASGTNKLGGPIEVPRIQFIRYANAQANQTKAAPPSPEETHAVRCCAYAIDLLRTPFKFKDAKWAVYVDAYPIIYDGVVRSYERAPKSAQIFGVKYNRSISEKQSVFDVLVGMDPRDVEGEIVVEVPSSEARQVDASRPWVLEGLGVKVLVNALGAQLDVPSFRFVGYYDSAGRAAPSGQ